MKGNPTKLDENKLWEHFKNGDDTAFLQLYQAIYQSLFAYGVKLSNNKELTKDAIQDIFMDLWEKRHKIVSVKKVKSYLFTYLRRKLMKDLVDKKIDLDKVSDQHFELSFSQEKTIIENEIKLELTENLQKALKKLTPRQREIIHLKFYEKMDYAELAEVLQIKQQSVVNLSYEAIKLLRAILISLVIAAFFFI
ncbi:sigma-70 family RNA polymerase sigma factor [Flammeovirgaceae bacterium SG7u.111]|nr:sigma-70 family RNA polymerase sigma factor [Flammeovirgaceae bacterium SG7u.132]WPO33901.1 sigma-70 family RNA polymerase sigma factor [Flammeovirgaceae bacterium SG7u.111]